MWNFVVKISLCVFPLMAMVLVPLSSLAGHGGGGGGGNDGADVGGSKSAMGYSVVEVVSPSTLQSYLDFYTSKNTLISWEKVWDTGTMAKVVFNIRSSGATMKVAVPSYVQAQLDILAEREKAKQVAEKTDEEKKKDQESLDETEAETKSEAEEVSGEESAEEGMTADEIDSMFSELENETPAGQSMSPEEVAQSMEQMDIQLSNDQAAKTEERMNTILGNLAREEDRTELKQWIKNDPNMWDEKTVRNAVQIFNSDVGSREIARGDDAAAVETALGVVDKIGSISQFVLSYIPGVGWGTGTTLDIMRAGAEGYRDGKSTKDIAFGMVVEGSVGIVAGTMGGGKAWDNAVNPKNLVAGLKKGSVETYKEVGTQFASTFTQNQIKSGLKNAMPDPVYVVNETASGASASSSVQPGDKQ